MRLRKAVDRPRSSNDAAMSQRHQVVLWPIHSHPTTASPDPMPYALTTVIDVATPLAAYVVRAACSPASRSIVDARRTRPYRVPLPVRRSALAFSATAA